MSQLKNLVIFIGSPGAGKGSLSSLCVKKLGWKHLSTGNLCRKHITEQTEIGKQIDFAIKSGKLLSDDLISAMVVDWFHQNANGADTVILDGYPRTTVQAASFNTVLKEKLSSIQLNVVRLLISDEVVIERLSGRSICSNKDCQAVYSLTPGSVLSPKNDTLCDACSSHLSRRSDDEEEAVRERLRGYHEYEADLLRFYRDANQKVLDLEVNKPIKQVFEDFTKLIGINE